MLDEALARGLRALLGRRVQFDEPLARHTSLCVGGPADALARVASRQELAELARLCAVHSAPLHVLGAGFNTLALDGGVRGVVVRLQGWRRLERLSGDELQAEAGATHAQLARFCAQQGLAGLEFAVGIPGTVGGWIAMNAGTREREMKDVVRAVELIDARTGESHQRSAAQLEFRYRAAQLPPGAIVAAARFGLHADDPARIRARQRAQLDARRATQPIDQPSCGSVFRNPPGDHAGRLIEAAGLKGARVGAAEISPVHANFIVTRSPARATDVLALVERARAEVARRFGVELELEVRLLGEPA
jgi:UDP-N-acetylmuramate dehydrogenase